MFVLKILLLVGLIKLLLVTSKPLLCAAIYVGAGLLMELLAGTQVNSLLIAAVIAFVLAAVYFWLLDKFQGSGFIWWMIMVVGFAIGFV